MRRTAVVVVSALAFAIPASSSHASINSIHGPFPSKSNCLSWQATYERAGRVQITAGCKYVEYTRPRMKGWFFYTRPWQR